MENDFNIELGDEVKCKITGFQGIVTGYCKHLTGCDRISIQPPVKYDMRVPDAMWTDVATVDIIEKQKVKPSNVRETKKLGGPMTKVERRGI